MSAPLHRRIPWADVVRWCRHHGYSAEDAEFMDRCFQAMDDVYLGWIEQQQKAKAT